MAAVLATVPPVGSRRVVVVVTADSVGTCQPWLVHFDGRLIGAFQARRDALAFRDRLAAALT